MNFKQNAGLAQHFAKKLCFFYLLLKFHCLCILSENFGMLDFLCFLCFLWLLNFVGGICSSLIGFAHVFLKFCGLFFFDSVGFLFVCLASLCFLLTVLGFTVRPLWSRWGLGGGLPCKQIYTWRDVSITYSYINTLMYWYIYTYRLIYVHID